MHLVGLTGGIGSGKSTAAEMLAELGAVVIDADQVARDQQEAGSPLLAAMAERFGSHIIRDDGSLDRQAVAELVFGASEEALANRTALNEMSHPIIQAEIARQIAEHADTDAVVILDHPLLVEHPRDEVEILVVIDTLHEVALDRLTTFRGMEVADARRRIASQASRDERRAVADHVIENNGGMPELRVKLAELWEKLSA